MRSVLFALSNERILVAAHAYQRNSDAMSLYRASLKLAFYLPLDVALPFQSNGLGFIDVSSVINRSLQTDATH